MTLSSLLIVAALSGEARAVEPKPAGWRVTLAEDAAEAALADPELAELVGAARPVATRTGAPRFTDGRLETPLATPLLLERGLKTQDPALRAALIEVASRAGGDWSEPVAGLLQMDSDADVRALAAELLDDADPAAAAAALPYGAVDRDPGVRAATMRAIGGRTDGAAYSDLLAAGLADASAEVRRYAARSAGWLDQGQLYGAVSGLLTDADAEVRLSALHAAERLDGARLRLDPALTPLMADPDPRISRAAKSARR